MNGQLYTLRYRHGNAGVLTEFVEADNLAQATAIGEAYVNQLFNARFIKVSKAVVADASILKLYSDAPPPEVPAPDDESSMPVVSTRPVATPKPTPPPPNPAVEKAQDAADEEADRQALLLSEQEEAAADAKARTNRSDPPSLPPLKHKK